jgi:Cu2+-exporting ATPase
VINDQPGSVKLRNPVLYRKAVLCQAIERELMSVLGVDRYETSPLKCWVNIEYDPRQLGPVQLIEILDTALANTEHPSQLDQINLDLAISTVSVPLAAAAQFAAPALLPVAAAVFVYTAIPSFKGAYRVLTKERRLGVDVLDSIVVLGCLATGQVFPGAVLVISLAFGRFLVRRTEDNSKRLLLGVFGKQVRFVWLLKDGAEIQLPLDRLQRGDVVVVSTGEVVPVDGIIVGGLAMIDQHALTGEATPAEKGVGDRVFASTIMVAGKMHVRVETSGSATASAKIAQILTRYRRPQTRISTPRRATRRQGGDPDAGDRCGSAGDNGSAGSGGSHQQ